VSRQRAKGTRFETEIVEYLKANGFPYAERRAMRGSRDAGDIAGIPGIAIEAKNWKTLALGEWMGEAEVGARNAGVRRYALWHKRRMKPIPESYVTIPAWLFVELLRDDVKEAA
jgi:hypothetical protein